MTTEYDAALINKPMQLWKGHTKLLVILYVPSISNKCI